MKSFFVVLLVWVLSFSIPISAVSQEGAPSAPGPKPKGFATLFCLSDALLGGVFLKKNGDTIAPFGGQVVIEALGDLTTKDVLEIPIRITHGGDYTDYTIRFTDQDESGTLNCGDTIVAVK